MKEQIKYHLKKEEHIAKCGNKGGILLTEEQLKKEDEKFICKKCLIIIKKQTLKFTCMIILSIKTNGNEKLLAIAHRDNKRISSEWLCDWNTVPNTLRIFHRDKSIDIHFNSFKECLKFIFGMKFLEQAERRASLQHFLTKKATS